MKIIQPGSVTNWQPPDPRISCKACSAVLEYERQDLRVIHYDDYGSREPAYDAVFVNCPECGARISVSNVPKVVIDRATKG